MPWTPASGRGFGRVDIAVYARHPCGCIAGKGHNRIPDKPKKSLHISILCRSTVLSGNAAFRSRSRSGCARVLRRDGKFAAVDPCRASLYAIGSTVFGKREEDVYCRPLTQDRVSPLLVEFGYSEIVQHGTITRYPLLALSKLGIQLVGRVNSTDDAICSFLPGLRRWGGSVACLGTQ